MNPLTSAGRSVVVSYTVQPLPLGLTSYRATMCGHTPTRPHTTDVGGTPYRSYDFGGAPAGPSSGCSWLAFDPRISVASNSVTTKTPGTGSSIISTTTVSAFGILVFATGGFLVLAARFFNFAFVFLGLAGFRRKDLADLRAFTRVAFPVRAAARFFRLAITVTFAGVAAIITTKFSIGHPF